MALDTYRAKRDFTRTPEPSGHAARPGDPGLAFVVQRHDASRLHYDLRLEWGGVLWSWAVPKGPSLDPADRRLAVRTEDHPVEYLEFEGVIPAGEYGAGTMVVWDRGGWTPAGESRDDPAATVRSGKLDFELAGGRLRGGWKLVKMGGKAASDRGGGGGDNWLLIKADDDTARPAPEPATPKPALARLTTDVPTSDGWVHEIKHDGYRILAQRTGDEDDVRLLTRKGLDWTDRFPVLARAVAALACHRAVIDGEVVALETSGRSDFGLLQQALSDGRSGDLVYYAFDLLHLDGWDLTGEPLLERKKLLAQLLGVGLESGEPREPLRYSDHVVGQGPAFHARACEIGLEGIVSKRADAPYRAGRKGDWKKIKCLGRQEMVVGGWTEPSGSRSGLGALLLGTYENGRLRYSGKVGTGFSSADLAALPKRLAPLGRADPPFVDPPTGAAARGAHWIEPELVAEIAFTEWTRDGALRHPSFQGLRNDKEPRDVRRERPADTDTADHGEKEDDPVKTSENRSSEGPAEIRGVRLSSPDKVLYPDQGVTKRDLALYYDAVADWCLPHVASRPLSLVRCPAGREAHCFYQKHAGDGFPDEVARIEIEEKDGELAEYLIADSAEALVALVQMGTLELHVWGSRRDRIERPDRMVLDLDPGEGVEWGAVVDAARDLRDRLAELGLDSFVKTTGGKGLHVVAPLTRVAEFDAVKAFSKLVAQDAVRRRPERYVANMAKAKRGGKIFVDYLRNGRGATFVAPYSTRARPGAPVSVPLTWEELSTRRRSDHYTVANTPRRLASLERDPWEGIDRVRQQITRAMWKELGGKPPGD